MHHLGWVFFFNILLSLLPVWWNTLFGIQDSYLLCRCNDGQSFADICNSLYLCSLGWSWPCFHFCSGCTFFSRRSISFMPLIIYHSLSLQPSIQNIHKEPEMSSPPRDIFILMTRGHAEASSTSDRIDFRNFWLERTEEKVTKLDTFLPNFMWKLHKCHPLTDQTHWNMDLKTPNRQREKKVPSIHPWRRLFGSRLIWIIKSSRWAWERYLSSSRRDSWRFPASRRLWSPKSHLLGKRDN